ncbi:hypothetical protein [uncultured Bacteroides sp.]|uniref:hypothetical protein n=1 Tax=uncultured Bacteroides sp. TaxID=162156 RepID=UPI00263A0920|nr:hypothetical protein [uncultured Bacteroides sp.]
MKKQKKRLPKESEAFNGEYNNRAVAHRCGNWMKNTDSLSLRSGRFPAHLPSPEKGFQTPVRRYSGGGSIDPPYRSSSIFRIDHHRSPVSIIVVLPYRQKPMFRVDREGYSVVVINIYIILSTQYNVLRGMSSRKNRKLVEAADTKKQPSPIRLGCLFLWIFTDYLKDIR